ncbi:MAG TPA: aldo/keto reductase [Gammaproteobacteria bacterium]|nr:aldo/keto reductase [Gammaproteobacteria bacterium]
MKTRKLGKTDIHLTELGFGGLAVGNLYRPTSHDEAYAAIKAAWHGGIRYFDTAPSYGYGLSERRIGDALREFDRGSYVISTKVGRLLIPDASIKKNEQYPGALPFRVEYDYSYDGIMRSFEHSLQRIGTHYIDMIYIHDIGRMTHGAQHDVMLKSLLESGYRALHELREQKVVRAIGLGVNEWEVCIEVMPHTDLDCFMLAGRYTLLEQRVLQTFFPECAKRGISVIAAGPYNSGVLANGQNYNYETADHKTILRVNAIQKICDAYQIDLPHAALQFPLRHSQVVSVVAGARTEEQVALSVNYIQQEVPERFWQSLKEADLLAVEAPV